MCTCCRSCVCLQSRESKCSGVALISTLTELGALGPRCGKQYPQVFSSEIGGVQQDCIVDIQAIETPPLYPVLRLVMLQAVFV